MVEYNSTEKRNICPNSSDEEQFNQWNYFEIKRLFCPRD